MFLWKTKNLKHYFLTIYSDLLYIIFLKNVLASNKIVYYNTLMRNDILKLENIVTILVNTEVLCISYVN